MEIQRWNEKRKPIIASENEGFGEMDDKHELQETNKRQQANKAIINANN